jgi:NAD-dependent deacetylase
MQSSNRYKNIVVLTGSGISKESGIPTFRDLGGLWEGYDINHVASPQGFKNNPKLVYDFYNKRRRHLLSDEVTPNAAHKALVELEAWSKVEFSLITQNVDDLHERSGSLNVYHIHGELLSAKCTETNRCFGWEDDLDQNSVNPRTGKTGTLRPDVVWFGEQLRYEEEVKEALQYCRIFIAIGTSGTVYPAAGYVEQVQKNCARTIELNLEPSDISHHFNEHYYGPASETVPRLVKDLMRDQLSL